jgi:hypothetical protein
MPLEPRYSDALGRCHGYVVLADDGWVGHVETPLYGSDSSEPDYLAVRTQAQHLRGRALVPVSLVREVDTDDCLVHLQGSLRELSRLPSSLPLEPRRQTRLSPASASSAEDRRGG